MRRLPVLLLLLLSLEEVLTAGRGDGSEVTTEEMVEMAKMTSLGPASLTPRSTSVEPFPSPPAQSPPPPSPPPPLLPILYLPLTLLNAVRTPPPAQPPSSFQSLSSFPPFSVIGNSTVISTMNEKPQSFFITSSTVPITIAAANVPTTVDSESVVTTATIPDREKLGIAMALTTNSHPTESAQSLPTVQSLKITTENRGTTQEPPSMASTMTKHAQEFTTANPTTIEPLDVITEVTPAFLKDTTPQLLSDPIEQEITSSNTETCPTQEITVKEKYSSSKTSMMPEVVMTSPFSTTVEMSTTTAEHASITAILSANVQILTNTVMSSTGRVSTGASTSETEQKIKPMTTTPKTTTRAAQHTSEENRRTSADELETATKRTTSTSTSLTLKKETGTEMPPATAKPAVRPTTPAQLLAEGSKPQPTTEPAKQTTKKTATTSRTPIKAPKPPYLPSGVRICSVKDPNLNSCFRESANKMIRLLNSGMRSIGASPLDPLEVARLELAPGNDLLPDLAFRATDTKHRGLAHASVSYASVQPRNGSFDMIVRVPSYNISGHYWVDGTVMGFLPLRGRGRFHVGTLDDTFSLSARGRFERRGGGRFLRLEAMHQRTTIGDMTFDLQNLFGNAFLSDWTNDILNDYSRTLSRNAAPTVNVLLQEVFRNFIQKIFDRVPYDDFFTDLD